MVMTISFFQAYNNAEVEEHEENWIRETVQQGVNSRKKLIILLIPILFLASFTFADGTAVVYFSATGNTDSAAKAMTGETGTDIFEIVAADPYTREDLEMRDESTRVWDEHRALR